MADSCLGVGVVGIGWVSHPHIDAWSRMATAAWWQCAAANRANAQAAVDGTVCRIAQVYTDYAADAQAGQPGHHRHLQPKREPCRTGDRSRRSGQACPD